LHTEEENRLENQGVGNIKAENKCKKSCRAISRINKEQNTDVSETVSGDDTCVYVRKREIYTGTSESHLNQRFISCWSG